MATRDKGIILYGTETDREKLAALASVTGQSGSELLLMMLRDRYKSIFDDVDPKSIILK